CAGTASTSRSTSAGASPLAVASVSAGGNMPAPHGSGQSAPRSALSTTAAVCIVSHMEISASGSDESSSAATLRRVSADSTTTSSTSRSSASATGAAAGEVGEGSSSRGGGSQTPPRSSA